MLRDKTQFNLFHAQDRVACLY